MKLANCFKQIKSYYEEGCEYEKIAKITMLSGANALNYTTKTAFLHCRVIL